MVGATYRSKSEYKDGNGQRIPNTDSETKSQIAKITLRPAEGHQIKLSYLNFDTEYDTGQPFYGSSALFDPVTFAPITYTGELATIYRTKVNNQIATAGWTYSRPDDRLFDFDGKIYWTQTGTTQEKIDGIVPPPFALGRIGDVQTFEINTKGADVHNSSRFDIGPFHQVLTIGGDGFRDEVDTNGGGNLFTPSGERTVSGAFVQLKSNYSTWLEIIGAARYDNYELQGGGFKATGDRVSPKITVGITPYPGITPYVTYAEGYRAPAVTETLVAGLHPIFFAPFQFIPNAGLKPEIGKTEEVGINFKFDNVFMQGDGIRAKVNAYRNNVTNYIDLEQLTFGQVAQGGLTCTNASFLPFGPPPGVPVDPDCVQYQNIANARLEGLEVETLYDAGIWFAGVNYSHVDGHNVDTGEPLAKIPPDSVTTTVGVRFFDRKLTVALRWKAVDAKHSWDIPRDNNNALEFPSTGAYDLVNLYVGYQPTPDILASLSVENLLDEQYSPYLSVYPNPSGSGLPVGFPQPGITIKGSLHLRFSDEYFRRG
jgi:hemoglobin/transferrin/lactoferrin receptor protein